MKLEANYKSKKWLKKKGETLTGGVKKHISGRWLLVALKGLLQEIVKNPVVKSSISCWGR